jgi:hypothetical protein
LTLNWRGLFVARVSDGGEYFLAETEVFERAE